jgi:hypothetical protein
VRCRGRADVKDEEFRGSNVPPASLWQVGE